jgi:WD40 repeat protein
VARVYLWRLSTGDKIGSFAPEGSSSIGVLAFSRDGAQLAVVRGGNVHIWSVADKRVTSTLKFPSTSTPFDVAFTADGAGLITCTTHPILWDIATAKRVRHFGPFMDLSHSVDVSPDGRFAVTTAMNSDLRIWEIATGTFYRRIGKVGPKGR